MRGGRSTKKRSHAKAAAKLKKVGTMTPLEAKVYQIEQERRDYIDSLHTKRVEEIKKLSHQTLRYPFMNKRNVHLFNLPPSEFTTRMEKLKRERQETKEEDKEESGKDQMKHDPTKKENKKQQRQEPIYKFLLGNVVKIYSSADNYDKTRIGTLTQYSYKKGKYCVKFEEGGQEWINLNHYRVEEFGDIVWAKVRGWGWWPAQLVDEYLYGKLNANGPHISIKRQKQSDMEDETEVEKESTDTGFRTVIFMGTYDMARISRNHLLPFVEKFDYHANTKKKKNY